MKCLICKHDRMTRGTTILPVERGAAILLITDIPARVCANCGEPYLDEATAQGVQDLADETLNGQVSYSARTDGERTILVAAFA